MRLPRPTRVRPSLVALAIAALTALINVAAVLADSSGGGPLPK